MLDSGPTDDAGNPIYASTVALGFFDPLYGGVSTAASGVVLDYQTRSAFATRPADDDPDAPPYPPDISSFPWVPGASLAASRGYADGDDSYTVTELRFRFGFACPPGSAGGATVKFRWRKVRVTGERLSEDDPPILPNIAGEESVVISLVAGETVWTSYQTVLFGDMATREGVSIIGPGGTKFIDVIYANAPTALAGGKLYAGFPAYVTAQADSTVIPEIEVYNRESASVAPGVGASYSGAQYVPIDGDDHTVMDTFSSPDVRRLASIHSGGAAAENFSAPDRQGKTTKLAPTTRQYNNGLVLTLSESIDGAGVATAVEDYLAAALAYVPSSLPPPAMPVWVSPVFLNYGDTLLGANLTSNDGVSLLRARSKFSVRVTPSIGYFPTGFNLVDGSYLPIYDTVSFTVSWDIVTLDYASGTRTVTTQSAYFSHNPADADPPFYLYGPVTTDLPAAGTAVWARNFRVSSPTSILELAPDPTFEITPGR